MLAVPTYQHLLGRSRRDKTANYLESLLYPYTLQPHKYLHEIPYITHTLTRARTHTLLSFCVLLPVDLADCCKYCS